MEYTLKERGNKIIEECLTSTCKDPLEIFEKIAKQDFIRIHGPEHHILDGAALLTAFYNAGGKIELEPALQELMQRGLSMPGATCGMWGVCGAVTSMGAALSIIDGTGPLTADDSWGKHMFFTSSALAELAKTGGPRCCKRDAFLSFGEAIKYLNENYDVEIPSRKIVCDFSGRNEQCIGSRCPFKKGAKKKVAFICVHNSCRSQIAEALGKHLAADVFESYSAGTETKPQINQDAVRIMEELYGIDMEQTQYSKLIADIPAPDVAISMGCNVTCPFVGRPFDDDWGLEDPTGKSDEEFKAIIKAIEGKILRLKEEQALKIGACFGSGMRQGEVCGACTGALMALGLKYGQSEEEDMGSRLKTNEVTDRFMSEFKKQNGSCLCKELLGCDLSTEEGISIALEKNLFTEFCPKMVESATKIAEDILG